MNGARTWVVLMAAGLAYLVYPTPTTGQVGDPFPRVDIATELAAAASDLSSGDADRAMQRLARVATREPDNPWMLYYRGAALLLLDRPYDAQAAFDDAADRLAALGDPDPVLSARIAEHRRLARRQVFSIDLEMGLAYDTNVSFTGAGAPELGFISGRSDGVFATRAAWSFAPIANEVDTLALGLRTAQSWHFRVTEFDFQDYGASLRYARRFAESWEASMTYAYDLSVLDRESYLSNHALVVGLEYAWPRGGARLRCDRSGAFYRFEGRDFLFDTVPILDRDGTAHAVGVVQSFHLRPLDDVPWEWEVALGYAFESVFTEGTEFDRRSNDFFLGCEMPLINLQKPDEYWLIPDKEARFRFDVMWELDEYRNQSVYDRNATRRRDLVTTYSCRVSQLLCSDARYGDITLHTLIAITDSDSNVTTTGRGTPFSYDKAFYGLQIAWSW